MSRSAWRFVCQGGFIPEVATPSSFWMPWDSGYTQQFWDTSRFTCRPCCSLFPVLFWVLASGAVEGEPPPPHNPTLPLSCSFDSWFECSIEKYFIKFRGVKEIEVTLVILAFLSFFIFFILFFGLKVRPGCLSASILHCSPFPPLLSVSVHLYRHNARSDGYSRQSSYFKFIFFLNLALNNQEHLGL